MFGPHIVTLYNADEDAITLEMVHNVTILTGVFLDVSKAKNVQKSGLADADSATLYIPFNVNATDGTTGAAKQYMPPKRYAQLSASQKAGYWTLETGGSHNSAQCFFVKGVNVTTQGYRALRENMDYVFDVTTVDIRDFGSEDMQHWQVGAR